MGGSKLFSHPSYVLKNIQGGRAGLDDRRVDRKRRYGSTVGRRIGAAGRLVTQRHSHTHSTHHARCARRLTYHRLWTGSQEDMCTFTIHQSGCYRYHYFITESPVPSANFKSGVPGVLIFQLRHVFLSGKVANIVNERESIRRYRITTFATFECPGMKMVVNFGQAGRGKRGYTKRPAARLLSIG